MNVRFERNALLSLALLLIPASCSGGASSVTPPGANNSGGLPAANSGATLATSYTLVDLGPAPGAPWLVPNSVNNSGTVVLNSSARPLGSLPCPSTICNVPTQAYVYQNGRLQHLPPLSGDTESLPGAVNNAGDIVGGSTSATTPETAVLWHPDLSIVNLGTGIAAPGSNAEADAISDSGIIAGASFNATTTLPTFFDGKGGATDPCGSGIQGYFRHVNDAGIAVGDEILSAGGTAVMTCPPFKAIETPPNPAWLNFGFVINNAGTVAGRLSVGPARKNFHPFMYRDGKTTDLGTLYPSSPDAVGAVFGMNQAGLMVGWSAQSGGTIGNPPVPPVNPRAFAYSGGKLVDLNTLLPASCANWTLIIADAVSDNGMITGVAFVNGYPNGQEHAFLMIPH